MFLKTIKIRNFRCFNSFSLDFGERATIIFGKNGSGKTTLIHALHKALSFIMYSDKTYSKDVVKGRNKRKVTEVKTIANNNPYLNVEGFSRNGDYNNHEDPLIEIEADADIVKGLPIQWKMSAFATNNRLRPSEFIEAFRVFYSWHKQTDNLPVLAYYSDGFPHKEDQKKVSEKKKVSKLRNFGYFDWNAVEGCTKEWISRLETDLFNIRQNRDLIEKLSNSQNEADRSINESVIVLKEHEVSEWQSEVDAIESCLVRFSSGLDIKDENPLDVIGLGIHSENRNLCIITKTGKEISFVNLPSGYKRLFSIVLDLSYRCYILNRPEFNSASGVAIIDEIDLHLHPELENIVLNKLLEGFPNIQFIVSTHSINVLTSIASTSNDVKIALMPLIGDEPDYFDDIYGIDANSGLQEIMGVSINGQELQRLIDQCAYMLSNNLLEQGEKMKEFIIAKKVISVEELNKRLKTKIKAIK